MASGFNPVLFNTACLAMLEYVARTNMRLMRIGLQTLSDLHPLLRVKPPLSGGAQSAPPVLLVADPAAMARLIPSSPDPTPAETGDLPQATVDKTGPAKAEMPSPRTAPRTAPEGTATAAESVSLPARSPATKPRARRQARREPSLPPDLPPGPTPKPPKRPRVT